MMPWLDLYQQHTKMRKVDSSLSSEIRKRLTRLAEKGHCDKTIQGRFTHKSNNARHEWFIAPKDGGSKGTEPLANLPNLEAAKLTVLALVENEQLHCLSIIITGQTKQGQTWTAAIHLDDDTGKDRGRRGNGACSHATFHCHIDPTLETPPAVRVPLPPIGPVAALDWVLSLVVPGWDLRHGKKSRLRSWQARNSNKKYDYLSRLYPFFSLLPISSDSLSPMYQSCTPRQPILFPRHQFVFPRHAFFFPANRSFFRTSAAFPAPVR
jgi:hypothetical protein